MEFGSGPWATSSRRRGRAFTTGLLLVALVAGYGSGIAGAGEIPARKLSLIRQALSAMKLDAKIQGLINNKVEGRVQKIRIDNPEPVDAVAGDSLLPDSVMSEIRSVIAGVYAENRQSRDGLDAQVYGVFDKYLTEDDLKFATNFNASDNGKRYRELAPRIVNESVQAGQRWSDGLDPEIRRRLEERFRGRGLKF